VGSAVSLDVGLDILASPVDRASKDFTQRDVSIKESSGVGGCWVSDEGRRECHHGEGYRMLDPEYPWP
jgi:hypothetical protein